MLHGALSTRHLIRYSLKSSTGQQWRLHSARRNLLTLAIETSCDDTCVAILEGTSRTSNTAHPDHGIEDTHAANATTQSPLIASQQPQARLLFNEKVTARNTGAGGIVPLEALDSHRANLANLVDKALLSLPLSDVKGSLSRIVTCRDGSVRRKPDFVSVTRGPGMRSNLSLGLNMAKGLAVGWQVPLLGVHHMQAHALTPRLVQSLKNAGSSSERLVDFPFLTLLVSGGHTMLLHSTGLTSHKILATTADVAIGDALDKCGCLLLSEDIKTSSADTAFGKYLSQYAFPDKASFASWPIAQKRRDEIARTTNQFGWQIQTPLSDTKDMRFSFGSFESQVATTINRRERQLQGPLSSGERQLLARTAIGTAFEHLGSRTILALNDLKAQGVAIRNLVVSGGVAANDFLRYYLRALLTARGFEETGLVFPPVEYCTDNAAMIAWTGIEMYEAGCGSNLDIGALRKWSMDADIEGGILGVEGWHRHTTEAVSYMPS